MMSASASAASQGPPLISVSIVSHGNGGELRVLLESLAQYEPAPQIQLVITDNLGRDLEEAPPAAWHSVVMIRPPKPRGYARNHNEAFRSSTGTFFCVLNPDVVFREAVFSPLVGRIRNGEGDIVAPVVVDSVGRVQDSFRTLPRPLELVRRHVGRLGSIAAPAEGALIRPDWIAGTFMLMHRETFARLEGFDARYRLYFEDVDLCTRARLAGLVVLVDAGLRIGHDPRRASRRAAKYLLWHVQSAVRFFASDVNRRAREMNTRG